MDMDNICENAVMVLTECVDEVLALGVVGSYIVGKFVGVEIPIELPAGVLAYYFVVNKLKTGE